MNASFGFSNETMGTTPGYVPGSGESAVPMGNFVGYSRGQQRYGGSSGVGPSTPYQQSLANSGGTPGGDVSPEGYEDLYAYPEKNAVALVDDGGYRNLMTPEAAQDEYWETYPET